MKLLIGVALGLLLAGPAAHAAELALMPVVVNLDRTNDRSTVQVLNKGREAVLLQADAITWTREGGQDRDGATDDLIVNPPLFTLQPGQTQVVRVGLRRGAATEREQAYRMVLREVPTARADDSLRVSGQVRVLVTLRVPVYVAPRQVQHDVRWQAHRDASGDVVTQISNHGNVHTKVGRLRLREGAAGNDSHGTPLAEHVGADVLFPGEVRSFRLRPRAPVAGTQVTLEVLSERGTHDVALQLAPR